MCWKFGPQPLPLGTNCIIYFRLYIVQRSWNFCPDGYGSRNCCRVEFNFICINSLNNLWGPYWTVLNYILLISKVYLCLDITYIFLQVATFFVNLLRCAYVSSWVMAGDWVEMLVLGPISLILPLLPLVFPVAWICLNSYGTARLTAVLHTTSSLKVNIQIVC